MDNRWVLISVQAKPQFDKHAAYSNIPTDKADMLDDVSLCFLPALWLCALDLGLSAALIAPG